MRISTQWFLAVVVLASLACGGGEKTGPTVSSVSPSTGTVGTLVTITGSGFAQSGSTDPTVTFTPTSGGSAVTATVKSFSATSLEVAVPSVSSSLAKDGTAFDVAVANPGTAKTNLAKAFTMAKPVITDVNGGLIGSGPVNSLFILDGNNFGDLAAAPASSYTVDFLDSSTGAVAGTATIDYVAKDWQNIFVVGTVPGTLAGSTTYKLRVTTPSGTSADSSFFVLGTVSFSPSSIAWTATSPLPVAEQGIAATTLPAGANTRLYVFGGNTASASDTNGKAANVATVYENEFDNASGALANATWKASTDLPAPRGFAAAVSASPFNSLVGGNGTLYVIGGLDDGGTATNTVYAASLPADGGVATGAWSTTTALPTALSSEGAVIFHGRIYVAGGNDSSGTPTDKVYSAKLEPDGGLDAWQTLPSLPSPVAYHQLVTSAGVLYVLGGETAAADPVSNSLDSSAQGSIYLAPIDIRSGQLPDGGWTTNPSAMGKNREKFTATVAGGYILVSGGLYSGSSTGASEESYASINTDNTLSSFNGATGSSTIIKSAGGYNFYNHANAFFVDSSGIPHVVIIGGADTNTGSPVAGVWYQH